jgi:hypothetical protein
MYKITYFYLKQDFHHLNHHQNYNYDEVVIFFILSPQIVIIKIISHHIILIPCSVILVFFKLSPLFFILVFYLISTYARVIYRVDRQLI